MPVRFFKNKNAYGKVSKFLQVRGQYVNTILKVVQSTKYVFVFKMNKNLANHDMIKISYHFSNYYKH